MSLKRIALRNVSQPLTVRQRRFTEAYVLQVAGNATEAARVAGYKGSDKTLAVIGHENLRKVNIRTAIENLQKKRERRFDLNLMSSAAVLEEVSAIAKAPWQDFIEVKYGKRRRIKVRIRLADKMKALTLMGHYYRLWERGERPIDDPEAVLEYLLKINRKQLPPAEFADVDGEVVRAEDVSETES